MSCILHSQHSALCFFFFFKQNTAYEMRISDVSSDVCASDLHAAPADVDLHRFAEQLGVDLETLAGFLRERVDKTEPGVVPGPCVFRAGIAQPDDESKAFHRNGSRTLRPRGAQRRRRLLSSEQRRVGTRWFNQCSTGGA